MTQDVLKQMPKKAKSKRWANNVVQVARVLCNECEALIINNLV
jgi:hypothetical protein